MSRTTDSPQIPDDYPHRIRALRDRLALTQARMAGLMGVSFASVNRWENGQTRPSALAWLRLLEAEAGGLAAFGPGATSLAALPEREAAAATDAALDTATDFSAQAEAVRSVVEAERLAHGYLFNPTYAVETSLIDPLPHQQLAVYEHMLPQPRLRFLLADDAGAGKTIMTGLYVREMLSRHLLERILIVCPAGLVGNWQRELRVLFGLSFRIVMGSDARLDNPFSGADGDRVIVSLDTLAGRRLFARLQEPSVLPYDLVVFDEAHKLSADREQDFSLRKTDRYQLAEALAGVPERGDDWQLAWSARHLLLLTATPHMGKPFAYYALWRLLEPEALSTENAFEAYPEEARRRHFLRRTKEEMVRYDGSRIFPVRNPETFAYALTAAERRLYDSTTAYLQDYYNRAPGLNRSAVRLAMSVFQRRLASSTYALLRSFERRIARLDTYVEQVKQGQLIPERLAQRPRDLIAVARVLDEATADEEAGSDGREDRELAEDRALENVVARSLEDLVHERAQVRALLGLAQQVYEQGEESKFEKLREVLRDRRYKDHKLIIFTEHRDTLEFVVRRLEGMGFAGRIASIHGGMTDYRLREAEVERFRKPAAEGGATYLVATDAAGEGINLQFCWLMLNYDIPWNPARLEQRMGRIHRYGQRRAEVIILNLVADGTREGRVLKTLLDKMQRIREDLRSDQVFDVIGRVFQGVSLREYLEQAITEAGANEAVRAIEERLTDAQVSRVADQNRLTYGTGGEVRKALARLCADREQEVYRRLLPGYVRRFLWRAAPLLGIELEDIDGWISLRPSEPGALDALLPLLEAYPEGARSRLTVNRPTNAGDAIFLHPGEPVFEQFRALVAARLGPQALRGAIFTDPTAERPYLFHLARVSVERRADAGVGGLEHSEGLLTRLVGLRQEAGGTVEECPIESLLLMGDAPAAPPAAARSLAASIRQAKELAQAFALEGVARRLADEKAEEMRSSLAERIEFLRRGFTYQEVELARRRMKHGRKAQSGDPRAKGELTRIKQRQAALEGERARAIRRLEREPELVGPGSAEMIAHALVVPTDDAIEQLRRDAQVEAEAVRRAVAHEEAAGATVRDVSTPDRARAAGLSDYPGFDLLATRAEGEERCIEVKGRAAVGDVMLSENEWARACNLRDSYWLYVVYGCATSQPRLLRVRDPFRLLVSARGGVAIGEREIVFGSEEHA